MGTHIINGKFQSDKYPTCPAGKVPLSTKDPMAQDLLWMYAQRRRVVDAEFSDDLQTALISDGFVAPGALVCSCCGTTVSASYEPGRCYDEQCEPAEMDSHDEAIAADVGTVPR